MEDVFDLFIVGGGINGIGIARDAAGRGLKVMLCEKADLANGTSSASTKLIHGGLRYLEHYEFRLVRESLIEREILLKAAPHIITPKRFILPHHKGLRPALLIRLGLFLYDHLGGRKLLPPSRALDLSKETVGTPLKKAYTKAFEYSDCWVDDARLVIINAVDARERGAHIETGSTFESAQRNNGIWEITVRNRQGQLRTCRSKTLINAAGPWMSHILNNIENSKTRHSLRLVKGSHIIVNSLFDGDHAYIFQNADGRVVFAIPYLRKYTLVGTTDVIFEGNPDEVVISAEEIEYLCRAINEYFSRSISKDDVVWHYAGIRPLYEDGSQNASTITRDYVFDLTAPSDGAPLLSIYGGKLTTFRKLAEHALEKLQPYLQTNTGPWTRDEALPGGEIENADFETFRRSKAQQYPWLTQESLARMLAAYGTRIDMVIGDAKSTAELGTDFGHGFYEAELKYLVEHEWARTAEDVLWRRTKLGVIFSQPEVEKLNDWFANLNM